MCSIDNDELHSRSDHMCSIDNDELHSRSDHHASDMLCPDSTVVVK